MAEEADADLRENRFSYLLQPIRDLASNWDINIAGELEEYLEELENLTFAIEGCGPSLNFAEAALLIQGTTCVYSKKVEYLHNLVYQALETIFNKRQKEKAGGRKGAKAADADGDGVDDADDAEAFLCLDDVVHEAQDIDLDEEDGTGAAEVLRPPTALLALEDGQAQAGDGDAGGFRLAQCAVHTSGALLLELKDGDLYDAHLRRCMRPPAARRQQAQQGQGWMDGGGLESDGEGADGQAAAFDEEDCGGGWEDGGGGDDWDEGGDIDLPDADALPMDRGAGILGGEGMAGGSGMGLEMEGMEGPSGGVPDWMQQDGVQVSGVAAASQQAGPSAAAPGVATRQQQQQQQEQEALVYFDPYAPLDHSDKHGLPIKPLKVRKPKRKATLPQQQAGTGSGPPLTGAAAQLFFPEFAYLLEAVTAAKRAAQLAQRPARAAGRRAGPLASVMDWRDAAAAAQADGDQGVEVEGEAGELGWGGGDAGAGAESDGYDYGGDDGGAHDDQGTLQDLEEAAAAGGSWLGIGVGGPGGSAEEGDLSYEELCRAHIDTLIAAAAAQQHQSELQVRVATWRQRIDPILQAEEDRSAFDIHHYGERIIDRLDNLKLGPHDAGSSKQQQEKQGEEGDGVVQFAEVVEAVDRFEVSRLFASMLQLINNRNVAIIKHGPPEAPFELQLLSAAMPHKSMGDHLPLAAGGVGKDGMELDASQAADGVENQRQPPAAKPAAKKARKTKAAAA